MLSRQVKISPPQFLILTFVVFIILGTMLLKMPISSNQPISWLDSLFTITSAMTVTGLVVVDTGTAYSYVGQVIIMIWIQIGGLGIMSFAILFFMFLGKKIGFRERVLIQQSLNQTTIGGVIRLVRSLFAFSLIIEGIAVLFLSIRWVPELGWGKGLYYSLFHAVSAFNNAGFGLWPDNLMKYVGDPIVNLTISGLLILGGLGFTVMADVWRKRTFSKLSLHSKLMIVGTIVLNIVAMVIILLLEMNNAKTLGSLSWSDKLWAAYFQGVSPRTAGFNTIDVTQINDSTAFFSIILMFIGAGSASTGGGIKLTTFIIIVLAVFTYLKGKEEITTFKRSIDNKLVFKSLAIAMISILFVILAVFILSITEKAPFVKIVYEVVSAFGTVGLSMGLTFDLTWIGKVVLIFIMFLGKLGPLTLAFSLARRDSSKIRYPKEDVLAG
ncbi:TrkH family potassium uptake protein [Priestia koreensis]|uniref:TrkH family potassium uptake protein n=1 Tax=Priestia koreensis TaxID=284581 RepID=UPI00203BCA79|nr:TrkH family potassium uptake protein [Priestia koreensis]MCM3007060.1 TrkH family potassium uptake protein [Priestia koreensis]